MKKLVGVGLSLIAIFLLTALNQAQPPAQSGPDPFYFSETGFRVDNEFQELFTNMGGAGLLGYPITTAYTDTIGRKVQYFQRVRIELHPENKAPYRVQFGLLGDELGKRQPPIAVSEIRRSPDCQYFQETGHQICGSFLTYWRANGGLDRFGYPISRFYTEGGVQGQYFQRAKMEWQPNKPEGQRVQLALLGKIYYDYASLDRFRLTPFPNRAIGGRATMTPVAPSVATPTPIQIQVTSLNLASSMLDPFVGVGTTTVAYLQIKDQLNRPLSGIRGVLKIDYPGEADETFQLAPSDNNGRTNAIFTVKQAPPGTIVPLIFTVTYPNLAPKTTTNSIMIWPK